MDLELSADQEALQQGIRKQLGGRFPMAAVRATEATSGVDRQRWEELGRAGVFALRLAEGDGGVGLGNAEGVLVFEELGRALVPGPLVPSHLAAGLVPGAATGQRVVGAVDDDAPARFVEHLAALDVLVVVDGEGISAVDPAAVDAVEVATPLDPLTPVHLLRFRPPGERLAGPERADRWRRDGTVLTAALQLGIAQAVTDAAVAYAKERVQFDRPIGSFQAIKHLLADMLVRVEIARAAVYAAGVTLDDPGAGDAARAGASAKLLAGEAAIANAKACIQVHGGMGFTWEADAHLFLKRARVLDTVFGSADQHAETLAALL